MNARTLSTAAIVAAVACLAGTATATTYTCPSAESITIGTIQSGSYGNLCAEDGAYEVLQEGLQGSSSRLRVVYTIPNVPAGTQYLNFWGIRVANSEGDDFQFYYNRTGGSHGILISGGIINKPFAPIGGLTVPLGLTTTSTSTIYILLSDTTNSGPILDTVTLDTVRVETR
jgi:hypothetical protein